MKAKKSLVFIGSVVIAVSVIAGLVWTVCTNRDFRIAKEASQTPCQNKPLVGSTRVLNCRNRGAHMAPSKRGATSGKKQHMIQVKALEPSGRGGMVYANES